MIQKRLANSIKCMFFQPLHTGEPSCDRTTKGKYIFILPHIGKETYLKTNQIPLFSYHPIEKTRFHRVA